MSTVKRSFSIKKRVSSSRKRGSARVKRTRSASSSAEKKKRESASTKTYQAAILNAVDYDKHITKDAENTAIEYIKKYYNIPPHIGLHRDFGPLSGSSTDARILSAYAEGNVLAPKSDPSDTPLICYECGNLGHDAYDCPSVF